MKTLSTSEKHEFALNATKRLSQYYHYSKSGIDGYNIQSIIEEIDFAWLGVTESGIILLEDKIYHNRYFLNSEWNSISYLLTSEDAFDIANEIGDFEYLSTNGGETCIFQTSAQVKFFDDDGIERTMLLQCIQDTEKVNECEDLGNLDWTDSYSVIY